MSRLPSQRHLFDIPSDVAYFNCAYNAPLLNAARERLQAAAAAKSRPWERTAPSFFADADAMRTLAAQLFGGDADGYAVIPSASYGLSAAARAIEPTLQPGDGLLVMAEDFPSNVLPWQRLTRERQARVVTVPTPADGEWTRAVQAQIVPGVKVVAASACHWTNGARIDLQSIAQACRNAGAALVVDVTQSLGAMPFDLEATQPDFLVAAGYKWLLFPYGVSLMYVAPRWRGARPLEESWLAREHAEDFTSLVRYSETHMPGARRFDVGEKCTALLPGALAALEQLGAWDIDNIAATLAETNAAIADLLSHHGFTLPAAAQRCPHMLGAQMPAGCTINLVEELRARNTHISQRGSALRFSPHLHVDKHDLERLATALDELLR